VPLGPRNCDQSSATAVVIASEAMNRAANILFIFDMANLENEILQSNDDER